MIPNKKKSSLEIRGLLPTVPYSYKRERTLNSNLNLNLNLNLNNKGSPGSSVGLVGLVTGRLQIRIRDWKFHVGLFPYLLLHVPSFFLFFFFFFFLEET